MSNNTELIHYLNSELYIAYGRKGYTPIIQKLKDGFLGFYERYKDEYNMFINPIMYPLSCLTEPINHYGVEQIPLVELAKIEGSYSIDFELSLSPHPHITTLRGNRRDMFELFYFQSQNSFEKHWKDCTMTDFKSVDVGYQLKLFNYLDKMCINHRGIENTIDPRSLGENNPYLIKK